MLSKNPQPRDQADQRCLKHPDGEGRGLSARSEPGTKENKIAVGSQEYLKTLITTDLNSATQSA